VLNSVDEAMGGWILVRRPVQYNHMTLAVRLHDGYEKGGSVGVRKVGQNAWKFEGCI
jgi:hypothetical protein